MNGSLGQAKWGWVLVLAAVFLLGACSFGPTEKNFVGVWKSSRTNTPITIYANGEWEIKDDDGKILQYGVWQVVNKKSLMWSYKDEVGRTLHDMNPIESVGADEFKVRERDNTVTTFTRVAPAPAPKT